MSSELPCNDVRVELSARLDGESEGSLDVDHHLEACSGCRRHQDDLGRVRRALRVHPVEQVPDLTDRIMERVRAEGPAARRRDGRWAHARTALVAAAAAAALLLGVTAPWLERPVDVAGADEILRQVRRAARTLRTYAATFEIVERGWHPDVGDRRFRAELWYEAPERFRLDLRDLTSYPSAKRWPRNDVEIVATPRRYWIEEPVSCPVQAMPDCASPAQRTTRAVVDRAPFDGTTSLPTDIIVPLQTLAGSRGFTVRGEEKMAGRSAYHVALPYRAAIPLVSSLQSGGSWRPFHPLDRIDLWIDEATWFPLAFTVTAGDSGERDRWGEARSLDDRPGEVLLRARVESFSEPKELAGSLFQVPPAAATASGGFRAASFNALAGKGAPAYTAGLEPYRAGTDRGIVLAYTDGMTWLKVTIDRLRPSIRDAAATDPAIAEQIRLGPGSLGYYRPAGESLRRQLDVFGRRAHAHLETNLERSELIAVAASLDVRGRRVAPGGRERGGLVVRRIDPTRALGRFPFVQTPTALPAGYDPNRPTAAVLSRSRSTNTTVVLYYRNPEAEYDGLGIRITQSRGQALPPSSENFVRVSFGGVRGRWSPERGELEWVERRTYRAVAAPSFDLATVVMIARGLE